MADRPQRQSWHPENIKAELRKRHGSITRLAVSWGYSRSAISNALSRPQYSAQVERRIAAALELPPHSIWPDRWHPNGEPRTRTVVVDVNATPRRVSQERQKVVTR